MEEFKKVVEDIVNQRYSRYDELAVEQRNVQAGG
jgi:hypothetical protein